MGNAIELFGFHDGSADLEKTALYNKPYTAEKTNPSAYSNPRDRYKIRRVCRFGFSPDVCLVGIKSAVY
jgi:hypothetical protein